MAISIDTLFPGGGVAGIRFRDETHIEFSAPFDGSPRTLWYYFRIRGAGGKTLYFYQNGLEHALGVNESRGYGPVIPVVCQEAGCWERLPEQDVYFSEDPAAQSFCIHVQGDECRVAFCYPYQHADFERCIEKLPRHYIRKEILGRTAEGRDYSCYYITAPGAVDGRCVVGLSARSHAGEVSGSFVLEGFLEALLTSEKYEQLLQNVVFCVFPMLDLDGVESGRYGKDRRPVDFNRDWSAKPYHVEIRYVQEKLRQLAKSHRLTAFYDLHAPQPGASSYMPPNTSFAPDGADWQYMWKFGLLYETICAQHHLPFSLRSVDTEVLNWGSALSDAMPSHWCSSALGCPFFCFEYAYHRSEEDQLLTPAIWRSMGAALLESHVQMMTDPEKAEPITAAERERIPSWAVPKLYGDWTPINAESGVRAVENEETLIISPETDTNHFWITSLKRVQENVPILEIRPEAPTVLYTYFAYYQNGVFLANSKEQTHWIDREGYVLTAPAYPGADSCAVSVRGENISGAVTLNLNPSREVTI